MSVESVDVRSSNSEVKDKDQLPKVTDQGSHGEHGEAMRAATEWGLQ